MKSNRLFLIILAVFINLTLHAQGPKDISAIFNRIDENVTYRSTTFINDAVYLDLKSDMLKDVFKSNEDYIKMILPITDFENVEMNLVQFDVFTDDFILTLSSGDTIKDYQKGKFYRGELSNRNGFATVGLFEDKFFGIISIEGVGNYNIGQIKAERGKYIIYNDRDVNVDLGIACNTTLDYNVGENLRHDILIQNRENCVNFYLEGDYALYQDKGSVTDAADYMTSLFAEMATLYNNESINIEINEIMVWNSADGYSTSSSGTALDQFIANNPNKNANLCHLFALGGNNTGGLAYVNGLCTEAYKFAYSNISSTFEVYPTYSWSVECITHETGHNLGSHHTHDCIWGPDGNTQIDDCGPEAGYDGQPATCYDSENPILPDKGTIMSYCHLLGAVGIDFTLGFAQEPGDLIRSKVANATCLGDCNGSSTCDIPVNVDTLSVGSTTADLIWAVGAGAALWEIEYGLAGFTIGSGTVIGTVNTTSYTLTGLTIGQEYDWYIRTDCGGGDYSSRVGPMHFLTKCSAPISVVLPFFQGWESENGTITSNGVIYCGADEKWRFETDFDGEGRVRFGTDANSDYVVSGSGALLMDRINTQQGGTTTNYSTLTLNMSNYSLSDDLLFKFAFKEFGDENHENDKVWVRGSESESWLLAYDILPQSKTNGSAYFVKRDLDSLLLSGGQNVSSDFQIRFGQEDNSLFPNDGILYDDIEIIDCGKKTIPYSNDFSSNYECWTVEDIANDGYTWGKATGSSCDDDYFGLEYNGSINPSTPMDDWLHSPGFYLISGFTYEIKFSVGDVGETEKLEVYVSSDNSAAVATTGELLFKDEGIDNNECLKSSIEFSPSANGYYFISFHGYSDANSIHGLFIDNFSISNAPGFSGFTIEDNTNNTCEAYLLNGVSGTNWHNIYKGDNIIASINPNGQDLGGVTVEMRDGGSVESYDINGNAAKTIPRYINFNSDNTFNSEVSIRLYILQSELTEYNNTAPFTSDEITDLQINHYDGTNENCDFGDNEGNGALIQSSEIATGIASTSDYYLEFSVSSFSEFLTHQSVGSSLPLSYEFDVYKKEDKNIVSFKLYDRDNIEEIIIQRKSDNDQWVDIENISRFDMDYVDNNVEKLVYYRMKFIEYSGFVFYSKIKSIERQIEAFEIEKLYPNPNNGTFTAKMRLLENESCEMEVFNVLGEVVYLKEWIPTNKSQLKSFDLKNIESGLYFIKFRQKDIQVVKKLYVNKK